MSAPLSSVTLSRAHADDARVRQIVARIDDGAPVTLLYGESATIAIAPGPHVLRANNTLVWKRVPFDVEPGGGVEFVLVNRSSRFMLGFLAILGVAPLFLQIEQRRAPAAGQHEIAS